MDNIIETTTGTRITVYNDDDVTIVVGGVAHTLTADVADNLAWLIISHVQDAGHVIEQKQSHENHEPCEYCESSDEADEDCIFA